MAGSDMAQGPLLFTLMLELLSQTVPLYALQTFNNDSLKKYEVQEGEVL